MALRTAETHRGLYEDLLHITRRFIPKAVDPKQVGTQALHARGKNNPCNCETSQVGWRWMPIEPVHHQVTVWFTIKRSTKHRHSACLPRAPQVPRYVKALVDGNNHSRNSVERLSMCARHILQAYR